MYQCNVSLYISIMYQCREGVTCVSDGVILVVVRSCLWTILQVVLEEQRCRSQILPPVSTMYIHVKDP